MSRFAEYGQYDALGLAELVRTKQISPEELLDEAIARVEERDPKLNAVNFWLFDRAKEALERGLSNGPFCGVPWLLKDLGTALEGTATTYGCALFKENVLDHDSVLVERYKLAGLNIFGKTTAPEFGITTSTESRLFGQTHNPWNLERTPGGSSGGTAAAIAARIVPASDGSDGGGSIRIPASCCGIVGLKPTRARIPAGPDKGEGWNGLSTSGQLSISVRDTAALLDISSGYASGEPYTVLPQPGTFLDELALDPGRFHIGFLTKPWNGAPVHADCKEAVRDAAQLCAEVGHEVEEARLDFDQERYAKAVRVIVSSHTRRTVDDRLAKLGRELNPAEDIEPLTYAIYKNGVKSTAADYVDAINIVHETSRAAARFFAKYDLLLTPTMAAPPVKLGGPLRLDNPDGKEFGDAIAQTVGFTQFFNMTGTPAISLPLYWNSEGMPIGAQFAAPYAAEATLLRLAAQLEEARPWKNKVPPGY